MHLLHNKQRMLQIYRIAYVIVKYVVRYMVVNCSINFKNYIP